METNNNQIPAFTVIKNGSILKNIFLIRKPSTTPQTPDSGELILLVGRHPHCHITLEHPSISRHHLRIHSNPSAHTLSVVDLSSVHGTWVSGRKIKPRVHVKLKEGDTMRLGASSRVYELHWVLRSQAYDVDEQFVPSVCTINEESDQMDDEKREECLYDNDLECLGVDSSNEIRDSKLKALDPLTGSVSDYVGSDTEVEHSGPLTGDENDGVFASGSIRASPVVSETTSATQVSDKPNGLEDQLMSNGSKSLCDDTEVEHSGSLTGNENDDVFADVTIEAPLVVSESTYATQVSDKLNGLEDQLMLNGSKSSCDVTEVEHSGPLTGNENDGVFAAVTIESPLVVLETTSATRVSDNLNGVEYQLMSNGSKTSCDDTEVEHSGPLTGNENDDVFASVSVQSSPVVSETAYVTHVSDNLNGLEDQLMSNGSKSSCDDTEVEHSGPLKGNENEEVFASVSVQSPLVVSETISATQVSDKLNGLEDQLMSNGSKTSCDVTEVEHSGLLTGNENDDIFAAVTIEAPLVVLESTSATRVSDNLNGLEYQLMSNGSKTSCDDTEVEHSGLLTGNDNGDVFAAVTIEAPLVVLETKSATRVSDDVNDSEDQLKTNCLKSSCDDTEIDHSSPWKDNENDELFTTVCIEAPLVASEDAYEKAISDCLNKSEDQLIPNSSKSSCDDTDVKRSSPLKTVNGNGELFTTVCIQAPLVSQTASATRVSDNSEDQLMLNCSKSSYDDTEVGNEDGKLFTTVCVQAPLVASEDISETEISVCLNESEDQLMLNYSKSSCDDTEVERSSPGKTGNENGELFTTVCIQAPLVVPETATWVSDSLNGSEDQLMLNCSKSLCDDTEVKQSSPLVVSETTSTTQVSDKLNNEDQLMTNCSKSSCDDDTEAEQTSPLETGNGNGELFTTVCVQAPLVTSEDVSETEISDCVNESEDKLNCLRDNLSDEFDHISYEKDETHDLIDAIEPHEKDALNENIARTSEIDSDNEDQQQTDNGSDEIRDVGCEIEQVNRMQMMEESATMVLSDGVDMSVNIESVDHETMKKESVFVLLPDVAEMDEDKTFTPDISEAKEMHTNMLSAQKLLASMKLFDRLDGKEVEFYTPDKENKNPNACSGISLSKQVNPIVSDEKDIFGISQKLFATDECVYTEQKVDQVMNDEEVLSVSSDKEIKSAQETQNGINSSQNFTKKRWIMVVDTSSLLDPKSLKHMKLLEGIKQTRLVVPKNVVRELMDINSQVGFFNRGSKKASLALKWIDECMMNTRGWIRMDDDDEAVHSSTEVPDVLAVALHLREQITDQKIIILSDNLALKIKAMAEGIMCEAAEEFRESLVNPFSERFLWVGSSARGLTWSCVDDHEDILRPKYHRFGFNGSQGFKGLKLLAYVKASQLVN